MIQGCTPMTSPTRFVSSFFLFFLSLFLRVLFGFGVLLNMGIPNMLRVVVGSVYLKCQSGWFPLVRAWA